MESNDKKTMPHRAYESTFLLLTPEQRKAELDVYEAILGVRPRGPKPASGAAKQLPPRRRVTTMRNKGVKAVRNG